MRKMGLGRFISIGGILTSIAVLFQSAPVFLSAIGLVLSPLSTIPVALAFIINIPLGFLVMISSTLILIILSLQESMIFLFSTGLIGIVIGILLYKKGVKVSIFFSTFTLLFGMIFLTYIIGIPVFGDLTTPFPIPLTCLIFLIFSSVYVSIWNVCLKKFFDYIIKIRLIR